MKKHQYLSMLTSKRAITRIQTAFIVIILIALVSGGAYVLSITLPSQQGSTSTPTAQPTQTPSTPTSTPILPLLPILSPKSSFPSQVIGPILYPLTVAS